MRVRKCFRAIRSRPKLQAICAALNKLFWKVPAIAVGDADCNADWWLAELRDCGIRLRWDKKHQRFVVYRDAVAAIARAIRAEVKRAVRKLRKCELGNS